MEFTRLKELIDKINKYQNKNIFILTAPEFFKRICTELEAELSTNEIVLSKYNKNRIMIDVNPYLGASFSGKNRILLVVG